MTLQTLTRAALTLANLLAQKPESWIASRYADTRRDEGGTPACWKRMPDAIFADMYDRRCAHRTLPCGTAIYLMAGSKVSLCFVLDRGPWGKYVEGDKLGQWRGNLDLSPIPATEVGIFSPTIGFGRVRVRAYFTRKAPHFVYKRRKPAS